MIKSLPIGIDDFKEIIENGDYYVDKTELIEEIVTNSAKVKLFPRPRRFGKTITLSMIENFFDVSKKEENKDLFNGLSIEKSEIASGEKFKYPVITIGMKDLKAETWEEQFTNIKMLIAGLYRKHLREIEFVDEIEEQEYKEIISKTADISLYQNSLKKLSEYLEKYYNEKVIVLIDEYDAPIDCAFNHGYYKQAMMFFKNMYSAVLKTNTSLKFACLTGVLRISKESLFSDLNNIKIYSVLDNNFSEYFGFTEPEVEELIKYYDLEETMPDVKKWYNGYNFGNTNIYNPWSILNYADEGNFSPYWANTSANSLLANIILKSDEKLKDDIQKLLNGETVILELNENIVYENIKSSAENIFNLFLMTGYITTESIFFENTKKYGVVKIPNLEVKREFNITIERWFKDSSSVEELMEFRKALLNNDKYKLNLMINRILKNTVSFHDTQENFYHGMVLGLIAFFGHEFEILSNREVGDGRYDLMIKKYDNSFGAVFEFKIADEGQDLEVVAKDGLEQIEEKEYLHELENKGIPTILKFGVAFRKKEVIIV